MEWLGNYVIETSFLEVFVEVKEVGNDLLLVVSGGDKAHIGCMVICTPRLSLMGDGKISCTSSVWNLTGHKDEEVCRRLAEAYCRKTGKLVVCTGGVHMVSITSLQIAELLSKLNEFIENEILESGGCTK